MSALSIVILAAGQGKRMQSDLSKLLQPIAGKAILAHLLETAQAIKPREIYVVVGHQSEQVKQTITQSVTWVHQAEQLGTAHAVQQALTDIPDSDQVLVLVGDIPLIEASTLTDLIQQAPKNGLALLSAKLDDPTGYGRVIRAESGNVNAIIEDRDCEASQRKINEVNTGILTASAQFFKDNIPNINQDNAQQEYYLTDLVGIAVQQTLPVEAVVTTEPEYTQGINDMAQLAQVERLYQQRCAKNLLQQGVRLADPNRIDIRGDVTVGRNVEIDVNVIFAGQVRLGHDVKIGAHCVLRDVTIADNTVIKSHSLLEASVIDQDCVIGPFARLRPGTQLQQGVHIGNFVETKKTTVGVGSKANHLTYLGDATIGAGVNIGAGTITCNYDGLHKHQTVIQDGAFIGSNSQLVAPVTIGVNATIGAGSTISRDAPDNALTLTRSKQKSIADWQRPKK